MSVAGPPGHFRRGRIFCRAVRQIVCDRLSSEHSKNEHIFKSLPFGIAFLGLPFRHGLARDAQKHGKLLLGHIASCAKVLKVVRKLMGMPFVLEGCGCVLAETTVPAARSVWGSMRPESTNCTVLFPRFSCALRLQTPAQGNARRIEGNV